MSGLADRYAGVVIAVLVGAGAYMVLGAGYLNYDSASFLAWGQELAQGSLPVLDTPIAPTGHPLATAFAIAIALLGPTVGYAAGVAAAFLSFGALVWAASSLARSVAGLPAAVLAGIAVATSFPLLSRTGAGFIDITFSAIVLLALLSEIRAPRSGVRVLGLLVLAGLLRPEAWGLSIAYVAFRWRGASGRDRALLSAAAVSAPLLWLIADGLLTGDPLYSFSGTREGAERAGRATGVGEVLPALRENLRNLLGLPLLAGGLLGVALALRRRRREDLLLVALLGLTLIAFALLGAAELPLLDRYVFVPAVVLAILAACAMTEVLRIRPSRERLLAGAAGALVALAFLAALPGRAGDIDRLHTAIEAQARTVDGLHDLAGGGVGRRLLRSCGTVYAANHRPLPYLAVAADRPLDRYVSAQFQRPRRGLFLAPVSRYAAERFLTSKRDLRPLTYPVPGGFRRVAGNGVWALYRSPEGC